MSKLYFRTGETEGFTSKKLADKKSGYTNPIRELLQNSLDASKDADNNKCEINIYIESIDKATIPHITDYEDTLHTAIKFQESVNSYNHNAMQIVNTIHQELNKNKLKVLMFVDNGKGMSPDILNGLIGERSVKSSEGSGGSFGVGHLSPYFLSSLRYVLYASKYGNNKTLFSGVPILAGFEDDDATRGATGRILKSIPINEKKPIFVLPTTYPGFIQDKMDKLEVTGSMVAILGLNKEWDEEAKYAIVSNFFYAINKQELTVKIDYNNTSESIDKSDIEKLLEKKQGNKRAIDGNILCGSDVYQAWLAVKDDKHKFKIELDNGDEVRIHVRNNIETDSVIVLIRNGMLIARHDKMLANEINSLRKNENFEPFSVVINVDEKECPKLFKLVKGAENPYHNQLEKNRLIKKDEKKLKKLFTKLSEKIIKERLNKRDRKSFNLSMPLLEIPNKAEAQGTNTSRPQSQTAKAKPNTNKPKSPNKPKPTDKSTDNDKKRPAPIIVSRSLEAKNSMRMKDKGATIDVELNITPQKMSAKDEVYLSMSLAQDKDNYESGNTLDFVSLSINGVDIEIPEFVEVEQKEGSIEKQKADKSQIKLGRLLETQTYSVKATIKKPKNIKDISVALKPFLGLKKGSK